MQLLWQQQPTIYQPTVQVHGKDQVARTPTRSCRVLLVIGQKYDRTRQTGNGKASSFKRGSGGSYPSACVYHWRRRRAAGQLGRASTEMTPATQDKAMKGDRYVRARGDAPDDVETRLGVPRCAKQVPNSRARGLFPKV